MDRGVVVNFDAERGFGFIRSGSSTEDVFVHIGAVAGGRSLRAGQHVRFEAEPGERGPRAVRVEPGRRGLTPAWAASLGLSVALLAATLALRRLGLPWPWAWLVAINPVTLLAFAWDKHRALREARRVPEWVLLALALSGGSPAAALAMPLLHHKTHKTPFRLAFAGVVVLQAIALVVWLRVR